MHKEGMLIFNYEKQRFDIYYFPAFAGNEWPLHGGLCVNDDIELKQGEQWVKTRVIRVRGVWLLENGVTLVQGLHVRVNTGGYYTMAVNRNSAAKVNRDARWAKSLMSKVDEFVEGMVGDYPEIWWCFADGYKALVYVCKWSDSAEEWAKPVWTAALTDDMKLVIDKINEPVTEPPRNKGVC